MLISYSFHIQEHDCKLTQEIVELIDREADLLMRGTKESNLEGLRKRISTLFLQYIKTPTFNAEAARLLKVGATPLFFCYFLSNFHWHYHFIWTSLMALPMRNFHLNINCSAHTLFKSYSCPHRVALIGKKSQKMVTINFICCYDTNCHKNRSTM